jgi:hypothetical protein
VGDGVILTIDQPIVPGGNGAGRRALAQRLNHGKDTKGMTDKKVWLIKR